MGITFFLFYEPHLQVQLFALLTLIYITYASYADFYDSAAAKSLETFNESVFCLIQYNFILLNNLVELEVAEWCGNTITGLTGILLLVNLTVISVVSIKVIWRKCYLRWLKSRALRELKMQ